MSKKGFSLIELLGVIILLSVVMLIAVPTIKGVIGTIRESMLNKKAEMIEEAALLYGGDIKGTIRNSSKKYNTYPCISIEVQELVPDYLDADNKNECGANPGCIIDPSDNENYLDKYEVIIFYKNRRVNALVDTKNELSCS